ncbi:unnamed protein product [Toxocara canis]|uniref:Dimer_Tnp_hAT domain-containing protein n=1 Tax=Toxocara canis TaxID=6265 RepID=A0A183UJV8_TOXCA|nr:unnamed protein product [Toxocara canis]
MKLNMRSGQRHRQRRKSREGCRARERRIAPKKKRCVRVLQNLMALPNVSLSVFLTQQFPEYAAALNPSGEDDNASTCADGDLLDFGEDEIDDFEEADRKIGLDMRFPKRLSCMAHMLQLALTGGLKASGCRAEVDALIKVVGKFRKTRLAAERLQKREVQVQYPTKKSGTMASLIVIALIGNFPTNNMCKYKPTKTTQCNATIAQCTLVTIMHVFRRNTRLTKISVLVRLRAP